MEVVLPLPLGPRKPKISPRRTVSARSFTAWFSPKCLLMPRTSMTTSAARASFTGVPPRNSRPGAALRRSFLRRWHRHVDRLSRVELCRDFRRGPRLDQEHELGPVLLGVKHGRREFGP